MSFEVNKDIEGKESSGDLDTGITLKNGCLAEVVTRRQARLLIFTATVASALALVAACGDSGSSSTPAEKPPVRGLADFHSHQFADLGFTGRLFTHSVDPTQSCKSVLKANVATFELSDLVRDGLVGEAAKQAEKGRCYPTATNRAGQQMDTESLKRAWQYGLRLLVVHAVNSEFLCVAIKLNAADCHDQFSIEAQLQAARALEAEIDDQSGGPGMGWYHIVTTPDEAREAIGAGKLAVVLGVETSNAFDGCPIVAEGVTRGVLPPYGTPDGPQPIQVLYRLKCSTAVLGSFIPSGGTTRAVALFEHYHALGARHFYLIHNVASLAGGHALFNHLMHGMTNPAQRAPGSKVADRVAEINRVIIEARLQSGAWNCSSTFAFDGGRCNTDGLTYTGSQLARAMASRGSVIDIDHLSLRSKGNLSGDAVLGAHYPVVSGHAGFIEISGGDKSHEGQMTAGELTQLIEWGGSVGPILLQGLSTAEVKQFPADAVVGQHVCPGTTESWIQAYRFAVSKLKSTTSRLTGKQAFVGVGFGSDFNGLAGWPRPRFDNTLEIVSDGLDLYPLFVGPDLTPRGGHCYDAFGGFKPNSPPHVTYPFKSPLPGNPHTFDRATLPWSGRSEPYDISFDGVAHVGMIPDFVEELRVLGLSDAELEPLWMGAEAYIRTWEQANTWANSYGTEKSKGIDGKCQSARSRLVTFGSTFDQTVTEWKAALQETRDLGCDYVEDN